MSIGRLPYLMLPDWGYWQTDAVERLGVPLDK